jgi:hypothetical protein
MELLMPKRKQQRQTTLRRPTWVDRLKVIPSVVAVASSVLGLVLNVEKVIELVRAHWPF